jgi:hypothetical protein
MSSVKTVGIGRRHEEDIVTFWGGEMWTRPVMIPGQKGIMKLGVIAEPSTLVITERESELAEKELELDNKLAEVKRIAEEANQIIETLRAVEIGVNEAGLLRSSTAQLDEMINNDDELKEIIGDLNIPDNFKRALIRDRKKIVEASKRADEEDPEERFASRLSYGDLEFLEDE